VTMNRFSTMKKPRWPHLWPPCAAVATKTSHRIYASPDFPKNYLTLGKRLW
jgi:hypothetical protein